MVIQVAQMKDILKLQSFQKVKSLILSLMSFRKIAWSTMMSTYPKIYSLSSIIRRPTSAHKITIDSITASEQLPESRAVVIATTTGKQHDQEQSSPQQRLNDVHCVTSLTKQRSSTRAEARYLEMELLNPQDLSFPPVDHNGQQKNIGINQDYDPIRHLSIGKSNRVIHP